MASRYDGTFTRMEMEPARPKPRPQTDAAGVPLAYRDLVLLSHPDWKGRLGCVLGVGEYVVGQGYQVIHVHVPDERELTVLAMDRRYVHRLIDQKTPAAAAPELGHKPPRLITLPEEE